MTARLLVLLLCLFPAAVAVSAQTVELTGSTLAIGTAPASPTDSSVSLKDLATTGGTEVLLIDTSTWGVRRRVLGKSDLPSVVGYTDEAETWGLLQTFTSGLTSNGQLTVGGVNDLLLGTGGMRVASGAILLRNIADTATIASFGDAAIALNQNTAVTGTASVSGLATLTSGFSAGAASSVAGTFTVTAANDTVVGTGGVRAGSGAVLFRNVADTATTASIGDAAIALFQPTTVNATLDITGLTTAAKIATTGIYGVADPLTMYAIDTVTPIMQLYSSGVNSGRNVVTNTGNDTVWEYHGTGNPSGSRAWRAGNIGGSFLIQSGNDAASAWTNLSRSTMTAGVPNGWFWGTGVREVTPDLDFTTNLGAYPTQYANLWIRNLWATTLVAQDVISTIGGAVLVSPTTELDAAVTAAATTFTTTHNEMVANDIAYINDNLQTEFVQVTAGPHASASSITFVADGQSALETVTIPAHVKDDLLVIFALANTATVPTLPAGWTNVAGCNASGGTTGARVGYKIATAAGEVSGSWTGATKLLVHVYRSTDLPSAPGACVNANQAASTTLFYPALTLTKTDHSSWVARAAIASAGTNIQTAPAGFVLRANQTAVPEAASFDSNGRIQATSVAQSANLTITSANWRSISLEIVGIGQKPWSYTVTRAYGGAFAARAWAGGVALVNTGTIGDGGINMYAIQSIKGTGEQGPTIQGYERTSATYNALSTRWALGNLYGLYNYGAVDTWGFAAGNAADVWLGVDATNGVQFFDAATTRNAHFALDGSITLGQTGAGQKNTYITPASVALRSGTVDQILVNTTGIQMYDTSANRRVFLDASGTLLLGSDAVGVENVYITTTDVSVRAGTTALINLNGTNGVTLNNTDGTKKVNLSAASLRFYDSGGTNYPVEIGANFSRFGYGLAGYSHLHLDNVGTLSVGTTTTTRMSLAASNGNMSFFGTDGTRTMVITGTTVEIGRPVASNPVLNLSSSTMSFCTYGGACTLTFDGATGNITSTGSIQIGTNGHIRGGQTGYNAGTGFFLGYDAAAPAGYKFSIGTPTGDGLQWNGSVLSLAGTLLARGGLQMVSGDITTSQAALQLTNNSATGTINFTASGGLFVSTGAASGTGWTGTRTVRAAGGAVDCTLIYVMGVLTGGTC